MDCPYRLDCKPGGSPDDPDRQEKSDGIPPTYTSIRTPEGTYVEYATGEREYYDNRTDPHQLNNTYAQLPADRRDQLHQTLKKLTERRGSAECTAAATVP
ncbi:hypothetical protein [Saccharopolyspora shandongensis]|uniref:hypothetical protein n=1 Tax=Saccharopolyspora shandongensis TaxID=418495 RepID=UPI0033DE347D